MSRPVDHPPPEPAAEGPAPEEPVAEVPRDAVGAVMAIVLAISLGLLALSPYGAKPLPEGKLWFLAPVLWPALALGVMAVTSAVPALPFLWRLVAGTPAERRMSNPGWAFTGLGGDLVYGGLFCAYLVLLSFAGFAISTWLFAQTCVSLSGLRGPRWWAWTLLFTAVLVIVLRVGMGLWFPQAPLFELLPKPIGNLLGRYL